MIFSYQGARIVQEFDISQFSCQKDAKKEGECYTHSPLPVIQGCLKQTCYSGFFVV
jgi:hypothetical protein